MREPISLNDSIMTSMVKMSEGNPGAATIIAEILKADPDFGLITLLHLDDMNMRGSQIWVAYKDYCGNDLAKFKQAIVDRDAAMVDAVNQHVGSGDELARRYAP